MKMWKRMSTIFVAALMVCMMSLTAFAANVNASGCVTADSGETAKVTVPSASGHTYQVYQIFAGDYVNDHNGDVLSNIKWGANGTGTAGEKVAKAVLDSLEAALLNTNDAERLSVIEGYANLSTTPVAEVEPGTQVSVPTGYYLVKDKDNSLTGNNAYSLYLVAVAKNVVLNAKMDVPSLEKKVMDWQNGTYQDGWNDTADYQIGESVKFRLEGTVSDRYDDFSHYYYVFHDRMEGGFTFQDVTAVKVDGNQINSGYRLITSGFGDDCSFEVIFDDLKRIGFVHAGSKISVEYTAVLNTSANMAEGGNKNEARLEFSNNPNTGFGPQYKPDGTTDETLKGSTGETPKDGVVVFTYELEITKVDGSNQALAGAEFTLMKKNSAGNYEVVNNDIIVDGKITPIGNPANKFSFKGLDEGAYKIKETKTPKGYNTIEDIAFTITADHHLVWEYDASKTVFVTGTDPVLTVASGESGFSSENGVIKTAIVNKKGIILPITGGRGTTMLYILGGIFLAIAIGLFVAKKVRKS